MIGPPSTTHSDPRIMQTVRDSSDKAVQKVLDDIDGSGSEEA